MHWFRRHPRGRPPHPDILTPAEWRVLEHVREGSPNAEIALRLGVSVNTVKSHVSSMLAKLELRDRRELAAWQGKPVASISQRSRSVWLFVAARLVGVTVLVGGLIVAFAVASAVLAGGGGGGFSPEPITTPTEPTPTPLVPSATATATSVAPPTETELFVLQANGLSGCEHPFYIRGWGLPASTTVRVEVIDPPTVLVEGETSDNGFLNSRMVASPVGCAPGGEYQAQAVDLSTDDVLATAAIRIPELARYSIEVNPPAGGCGGITVTFRDMPPDTRVSLMASGVDPFSHEAWEVVTMLTDSTGYAESAPFDPPWSCETPALALSASATEDPERLQGGGLLYRIALGPDEPIPGLD